MYSTVYEEKLFKKNMTITTTILGSRMIRNHQECLRLARCLQIYAIYTLYPLNCSLVSFYPQTRLVSNLYYSLRTKQTCRLVFRILSSSSLFLKYILSLCTHNQKNCLCMFLYEVVYCVCFSSTQSPWNVIFCEIPYIFFVVSILLKNLRMKT